jgi:hypothetical protein
MSKLEKKNTLSLKHICGTSKKYSKNDEDLSKLHKRQMEKASSGCILAILSLLFIISIANIVNEH